MWKIVRPGAIWGTWAHQVPHFVWEFLLLAEHMHLDSPNWTLRVTWFQDVHDLVKYFNCLLSHSKAFGGKDHFLCNSLMEEIGKRLLDLILDSCKEQYVTEYNWMKFRDKSFSTESSLNSVQVETGKGHWCEGSCWPPCVLYSSGSE